MRNGECPVFFLSLTPEVESSVLFFAAIQDGRIMVKTKC
jgi:hypothetical protein